MTSTSHKQQRNPLQRDGLTQVRRLLQELDPAYAKLDDRTLADCLAFAWEYSRHLRYFDTVADAEVREDGTWQDLMRYEPLFFLALMASTSVLPFRQDFEAAMDGIDPQAVDDDWRGAIRPAFESAYAVFEQILQWQQRSAMETSTANMLRQFATGQCARQVVLLLSLYDTAFGDNDLIDMAKDDLADWQIDFRNVSPYEFPPDEWKYNVARELRNLFTQILDTLSSVVTTAEQMIEADATTPDHNAHIGLFIAFLRLFEHSRNQLNELTRRHLDFYLQDLLQLKRKEAEPDRVHLVFEAARHIDMAAIGAGTGFRAGKDSQGTALTYELEDELVVNRATVAELRSILCELDGDQPLRVRRGDVANSADGLGTELSEDDPKWSAFGTRDFPFARLGMAIATPLFRLSEGDRTIVMDMVLSDASPLAAEFIKAEASNPLQELPSLFKAEFSAAEEWVSTVPTVHLNTAGRTLRLVFSIDVNAPPIVDVTAATPAAAGLPTGTPVLKLTVDQAVDHAYDALRRTRVQRIDVKVDVKNVRSLVLQNETGPVKAAKPFQPFGSKPRIGSPFYIGNQEVFAKPLTEVTLGWDWVDAPDDLGDYFRAYTFGQFQYRADVDVLMDYKWTGLRSGVALSSKATSTAPGASLIKELLEGQSASQAGLSDHVIQDLLKDAAPKDVQALIDELTAEKKASAKKKEPVEAKDAAAKEGVQKVKLATGVTLQFSNYAAAADAPSFRQFDGNQPRGGIRFELTSPSFCFGHKDYQSLYTEVVLNGVSAAGGVDINPSLLPNLPYTPVMENLRFSYKAMESFDLTAAAGTEPIFVLGPFGAERLRAQSIVPDFMDEGQLLIGLANLKPPQNLSLLVQFAEGSGNPFVDAPDAVSYSYLTADGWVDFHDNEVLKGGTNGFLQSGILQFAVPATASAGNPIMPTGMHWLRVSADKNIAALDDVLTIQAQAATAVFKDNGNAADHLNTALPAGTIAKFVKRNPAVKSVTQPYASIGGRPVESADAFYIRTSERLRHKDYASTIWDYEHLVLEQFPDLHKVKVLNHTCPQSELNPGHVMVVVIPDLRDRNSRYPLRPAVPQSCLAEIEQFLTGRISPFVQLHVVNPAYERIRVLGSLTFRPGVDPGLYNARLHADITAGLTPWLTGGDDISFAGRIHSSVILNLIEELPYVDYIRDFSITHFVDDKPRRNVDEVVATRSRAILVSDDTHTITGVKP